MEVRIISVKMQNGPKKGDGWDFMDDEDEVWLDAFETVEQGGEEVVDVDAYDEFGNIQEIVNFVAGTGSYRDRRAFEPGEADIEAQRREMKQASSPKCPACVQEIREMLTEGAMRGEIDKNPYVEVQAWVNEEDAEYHDDYSSKVTGHAMAYCPDHSEESFLHLEQSWFEDD